ncbi:MAG TPA: hypothetical protein VJK51_03145 [Candidatus Nanoarchaeia archaeon]|nr:hypothetical protein [Candidatus Nanoarchaeia archaeon]
MDINDCMKKGEIRKTAIDKGRIQSLIEMSDSKEKVVKNASLDEDTVSAFFSLAYESLREVLEAIAFSKGYKVMSHICLGELLKELLPDFDFIVFDRLRYTRNSINYYGKKIEYIQGK